jgi:hypothetical protein
VVDDDGRGGWTWLAGLRLYEGAARLLISFTSCQRSSSSRTAAVLAEFLRLRRSSGETPAASCTCSCDSADEKKLGGYGRRSRKKRRGTEVMELRLQFAAAELRRDRFELSGGLGFVIFRKTERGRCSGVCRGVFVE